MTRIATKVIATLVDGGGGGYARELVKAASVEREHLYKFAARVVVAKPNPCSVALAVLHDLDPRVHGHVHEGFLGELVAHDDPLRLVRAVSVKGEVGGRPR
jgi:hypothetical protein